MHRASAASPRVPAEPSPLPPAPRLRRCPTSTAARPRKVGQGKVEIDGRIDLHGMRQAEARAALRRFNPEGDAGLFVITQRGHRYGGATTT